MANTKIIFLPTESSGCDTELVCYHNTNNEIFIAIDGPDDYIGAFIALDKPTAIKFAKTLRTEINELS